MTEKKTLSRIIEIDIQTRMAFFEIIKRDLFGESLVFGAESKAEKELMWYLEICGCEGLLESFCSDIAERRFTRAADFLRVLARSSAIDIETCKNLVARGLSSENVEVRIAASFAARSWGLEPNRRAEKSIRALKAELYYKPIESGVEHDAEHILSEHLKEHGEEGILATFERDIERSVAQAADFLKVLGRSSSLSSELRKNLVARGLSSENVEVLDATIQAVENWGDSGLAEELRAYSKRELRERLRQYAIDVAENL